MTRLSVNLNKVALVRNTRDLQIPNVIEAAEVCIAAGAQGITVHPRPDQRHIRPLDVYALAGMLTVEFNIEGNPQPDYLQLVRRVRPTQCTLVPDDPGQRTSDHGWDLAKDGARLEPLIRELKDLGIRVSLFMDADSPHLERARELGADRIELYTQPYAASFEQGRVDAVLPVYVQAAQRALAAGLGLNAGHDLNRANLGPLLKGIPQIAEVSIGHALIAEALFLGLGATVKAYLQAIQGAAGAP